MNNSIYKWISEGLIKPEQQQEALQIAGERPTPSLWRSFSKNLLLMLGLLSLAFGVIFFFAFNWNEMGRMSKFMILQIVMVASFVAYFFKSNSYWLSQALLLMAVLVLGALLALFGQTYQTGADPWQLFATWALLITPLVLFSKSEVLWVFWALLINTGLVLYLDVNNILFGAMFSSGGWFGPFLLVNTGLVVLLELLSYKRGNDYSWLRLFKLQNRWVAQILGVRVIYILTVIGMHAIWESSAHRSINFILYVLMMSVGFLYYRFKVRDLLLLTAWMLSVMVFVLTFLVYSIFYSFDAGSLLLMAICLIGMTTGAVKWIKNTHELFQSENVS